MRPIAQTERTQLGRLPKRGTYMREAVYSILDEGLICHVGFVADGTPFVIPTAYAHHGDTLYIHGSAASRMLRALGRGAEACITITLLDGLVLARSAFHHSMNYRSVVILGRGRLVEEPSEKLLALERITEHLVPGRWKDVRHPSTQEMKATAVLAFALEEASAKIRTGPPGDDEEDYALNAWAGVLPLTLAKGEPIRDTRLPPEIQVPGYVSAYDRSRVKSEKVQAPEEKSNARSNFEAIRFPR
jgi:nitroimidazol reductase NimA-like FMN-containing flavoprotein (pyridoxamine 5'-phosphate oxidase superfamily)